MEDISSMICALAPDEDACQGDSGGPMVVKESTSYVLAGMES